MSDWGGVPKYIGRMERIDLAEKLRLISDHWNPRIIAELNGQHVKLAKLLGPFTWHHHSDEDELFLVLRGRLQIEFRDRTIELGPGQLVVVPRGMEHRPVAEEEVHVVLFEPAGTVNTGNVREVRTREKPDRI